VFRALYGVAERFPQEWAPILTQNQWHALRIAYGDHPTVRDNDAMVPTLSQVWGEIVHAAWADHLDIIGHFHAPEHEPLHVDWLHTGTGFGLRQFEALWDDVAAFLMASG
jgi:triacylglycerol lipase